MISREDIVGLCGLTEEELDAVAEHEHAPDVAAAALAAYLLSSPGGALKIVEMIRDDIRAALARGDGAHAGELLAALRHFLAEHREACAERMAGLHPRR